MSWLKYLNPVSAALNAGGAVLSGISSAKAKNRGAKFEGQTTLEQLMLEREKQLQSQQIARETEGRASASDAWRKLLATSRTLNPGARPQLSPYSVAPRQASEAETTGASALQQEVMARLQGGNPIPTVTQHDLEVDRRLLDPSKSERWLGYIGAGLGAA